MAESGGTAVHRATIVSNIQLQAWVISQVTMRFANSLEGLADSDYPQSLANFRKE